MAYIPDRTDRVMRIVRPRMNMRITCLFVLSVLLISCNVPLRIKEVARVASATGQVDAIVIEANTGAASSSSYDIFLVHSGEGHDKGVHVASLYAAMRNEKSCGVNLKWDGQQELAIEYMRADAAEVLSDRAEVGGQELRVVLREGIEDAEAPEGMMQDNVGRKRADR